MDDPININLKAKHQNTGWGVIIVGMNVFTGLFWYAGQHLNVYDNAFLGAVYEVLWLPLIGLLLGLPVISFILWVRQKFSTWSLFLYALIIGLINIWMIIAGK